MTTATPTPLRGRPLLGPLSFTAALGALLVSAAAVLTGSAGAVGAAVGAVLVCVIFASGALVIGAVTRVAPTASLLVALVTYTLQIVVVAGVYAGLSRGGALDGPVDPRWVSAAVIACTLTWTTSQVIAVVRGRQPIYDEPSQPTEASVR
jgi:ATP synthase protein I